MKVIKNLIIILFIVALVFIGVGFVSGATWDSMVNAVTSNNEYIEQDPIVYTDIITSLVVDVDTRSVEIISTDDSDITINHYRIEGEIWNISLQDGILTISQQNEPGINGWFVWRLPFGNRNDVIITIPSSYQFDVDVLANTGSISLSDFDALEEVNLESDTGSIHVQNVQATDFNLSTDTGSLNITNVDISNDAILETNTGSITINQITSENLAATVDAGSINITSIETNRIDLSSDTGSINVSQVDLLDRTLHLSTSTGTISVKGVGHGNNYDLVLSNIAYYINAQTDTGSIHIND